MSSFTSDDGSSAAAEPEKPEVETPSFVAEEKSQLQDELARLMKENSELRAQFEEAINISKSLDDVHQKYRKMTEENGKLRSEKDNLEKRLEISLRATAELQERLDEEKSRAGTHQPIDYAALHREVQQAKDQAKTQVETVCKQIQEMKDAKEQVELEQKVTKSKIEKLIGNASRYFDQKFEKIEDVIAFLGTNERIVQVPETAVEVKEVKKSESKTGAKLKKNRAKVKALKSANAKLSEGLKSATRERDRMEKMLKREVEMAETKCLAQQEENERCDVEHKRKINALEAQIESLKNELARKREVPRVIEQPAMTRAVEIFPDVPRVEKTVKKNEDLDLATNELIERNDELKRQVQATSEKRDEYRDKLQKVENANLELTVQVNKQKNELQTLKIVHQETLAELQTYRAIVQERESEKEFEEKQLLKQELYAQKAQVKMHQHTIEVQKKQIHELSVEKEETAHAIEKKAKKVDEMKQRVSECEKQIEDLKMELTETRREFDSKPVLTPEDVMPVTVWTFPGFPAELNLRIGDILHDGTAPATKLHMIYKVINQYFTDAIASRNVVLDQALSENQKIRDSVHAFISSISIALELEPVTFDAFFSTNASEDMIKRVTEMKSDLAMATKKNGEFDLVMKHIQGQLGVKDKEEAEQTITRIGEMKRKLEEQSATIKHQAKKCKGLSKKVKSQKKKISEHKSESTSKFDELHDQLESTTQKLDFATRENKKLKNDLDALQDEYRAYKMNNDATRIEPQFQGPSPEAIENENLRNNERILQQQIANHKARVRELEDSLDEANNVIQRLKQTIQAQKSTISEKDEEITATKKEANDQEKLAAKRTNDEKQQLVENYEKTISELRSQCDTHRKDAQRLSQELAESKTKLKQDKNRITQLKKTNVKSEKDIHALQEQMEREKKLSEASARAAVSKAESDCAAKLSEQKTKFEAEKRQLIAYVADSFKQFYNPQEVINERTFKSIVSHVRDELTSLTASNNKVRQLVGASQTQKTEDVVAQALQGV